MTTVTCDTRQEPYLLIFCCFFDERMTIRLHSTFIRKSEIDSTQECARARHTVTAPRELALSHFTVIIYFECSESVRVDVISVIAKASARQHHTDGGSRKRREIPSLWIVLVVLSFVSFRRFVRSLVPSFYVVFPPTNFSLIFIFKHFPIQFASFYVFLAILQYARKRTRISECVAFIGRLFRWSVIKHLQWKALAIEKGKEKWKT